MTKYSLKEGSNPVQNAGRYMPAAAATATDDAKTTTKQSCKVWLCRPATMDVGRLSNLKSKTQQKMLWLIHRLTGLHVWFADKDWIQLPSQSIKRVLGRNYHRVIEIAVSLGFIEFKKSYLAGKRCKSFRLVSGLAPNTDIASGVKMAWAECSDKVLKENIISEWAKRAKDDAMRYASSDLDAWLLEALKDAEFPYEDEQYEDVQLISSKHPYYTICAYGRRHTPFTRLPSNIRSHVFFRSRPESRIYEIDIMNSQPVFLLIDLMENEKKCSTYNEQPSRLIPEAIHQGNHRLPQPPKGALLLCGTLCKFRQDVEDGELYDRLMKELGVTDRKAFKEDFFAHILYGRVGKWAEELPIVQAFVRLYPEVWRLICEKKAADYRDLARRMQQRESDFVFGRALPRFMKEHPAARVLTVHDAIYCEERHKYELINILNEEFAKLGVQANLRVTALAERQRASEGRSASCVAP